MRHLYIYSMHECITEYLSFKILSVQRFQDTISINLEYMYDGNYSVAVSRIDLCWKKSAINKHEAEPWMQKVYFLKKYIIYSKNNEQAVFISNI